MIATNISRNANFTPNDLELCPFVSNFFAIASIFTELFISRISVIKLENSARTFQALELYIHVSALLVEYKLNYFRCQPSQI